MKGNRTNHPSRAGVPLKDGRTAALYMKITPDALTKLKAIVANRKQSRSDYLQDKIEEDYGKIQQGETNMSYSAYKSSRKNMLAELRKLGVASPSDHYPQLSIDSDQWENQLFNMQGHIAEIQERNRYAVKAE